MMEGEHDIMVQKLSLSSDQLVVKRERVDIVEASVVVMFTCLERV